MICLSKIRMSMHFPCPAWTYGWQCLTVWFCSKVVSGLFRLSYDGREAWRAGTRVQDGKQRFVQSRVPQNQCFIMFHHVSSCFIRLRLNQVSSWFSWFNLQFLCFIVCKTIWTKCPISGQPHWLLAHNIWNTFFEHPRDDNKDSLFKNYWPQSPRDGGNYFSNFLIGMTSLHLV